jgi:hypothetical protein
MKLSHSLILSLFLLSCIACGKKPQPAETAPVNIPASVFYNHDSIMAYAELAYLHDDPKGLFVTGAAYYLRRQGDLPDSLGITTVERDEADIMLLRSAELGYQPARDLIHCLSANGEWQHSIPENK